MKATEAKSVVLLHHHLKALRLPTVAAECEKVATQAAADNADHLSYLLRLTELELLEREKRAAERRVKAARFPTIKTLETFDFAARPSVNKILIAELMRCEYIDKMRIPDDSVHPFRSNPYTRSGVFGHPWEAVDVALA